MLLAEVNTRRRDGTGPWRLRLSRNRRGPRFHPFPSRSLRDLAQTLRFWKKSYILIRARQLKSSGLFLFAGNEQGSFLIFSQVHMVFGVNLVKNQTG